MSSTGIYIHLPFCSVRCSYCAFAVTTDQRQQEAYVNALVNEIAQRLPSDRLISTLYFGGGTPSRLEPALLERITGLLVARLVSGAEVTLEANPEDVSANALDAWQRLGINRLSLGIQSFHDAELQPLGRMHGGAGARRAIALARERAFRLSLDLMLGLPGQTASSYRESLREAAGSGCGHISLYMLDLERGTALDQQVTHGRATLPEDDLVATLYIETVQQLAAHGFRQYEISNFARRGEESRHNLAYWNRTPYLGFGLGAHSYAGRRRFANTRDLTTYLEQNGIAEDFCEELGTEELRREEIFLSLRQAGGLDYRRLEELNGQEAKTWIERGTGEGWLRNESGRVAFTPAGFLLSNEYLSELF